jgi:hypothetical protein
VAIDHYRKNFEIKMKNITAEGVYRIIQDEIRHHQRRKEMRITGTQLRKIVRESIMADIFGTESGEIEMEENLEGVFGAWLAGVNDSNGVTAEDLDILVDSLLAVVQKMEDGSTLIFNLAEQGFSTPSGDPARSITISSTQKGFVVSLGPDGDSETLEGISSAKDAIRAAGTMAADEVIFSGVDPMGEEMPLPGEFEDEDFSGEEEEDERRAAIAMDVGEMPGMPMPGMPISERRLIRSLVIRELKSRLAR